MVFSFGPERGVLSRQCTTKYMAVKNLDIIPKVQFSELQVQYNHLGMSRILYEYLASCAQSGKVVVSC